MKLHARGERKRGAIDNFLYWFHEEHMIQDIKWEAQRRTLSGTKSVLLVWQ